MFPAVMSNSASVSDEATICSGPNRVQEFGSLINPVMQTGSVSTDQQPPKKKRNLPGNPDPDAEVIALSPTSLMATNRFVCEICNKGFQRDQNLQLHRRGHNLPWKLKQRNGNEIKKRAYVCPEPACVHHHPSRALGDLTGIKKHYCRKHGEKKWKCEKCSKVYAVQSDWKAHSKTCGTKEYRCDCGTIFSRKDSFITHRAFCDALAEESARLSASTNNNSSLFAPIAPTTTTTTHPPTFHFNPSPPQLPPPSSSLFPFSSHHRHLPYVWDPLPQHPNPNDPNPPIQIKHEEQPPSPPPPPLHLNPLYQTPNNLMMTSPFRNLQVGPGTTTTLPSLSATALLQKAASVGPAGRHVGSSMARLDVHTWQKGTDQLTRDFLGLTDQCGCSGEDRGGELLSYVGAGVEYQSYDRDHSLLKHQGFGFADHQACSGAWGDC